MATTNKNFKVKNGLEVANAIGVGATPSFGTAGQILVSAGSNAAPTWEDPSAGGGGISNVVEDTTPQLGGDLDAQGYDITNLNSLTFDTTPTSPGTAAGTIYWDDGDGVPKAILNANVTVGVNQELILKVKNATGTTITKGSVVYINGAQGQNPTIALANATTEGTSSKTFGFTAEAIIDGAEGFLIAEGIFRGANTDGLVEGDPIYLSTTAGQYTQTIPAEPAHSVFLGYVVKAHASAGEIIVKIQNGYELTELHGVTIANTAATNDILQLNSSGIWVNANLATAGIANLSGATFTGNVVGTNANLSGNVNAVTVNATTLRLTSTTDLNLSSTNHAFQIGSSSTFNMRMDINELQTVNNNVASALLINNNGGNVTVGNTTSFTTIPGKTRLGVLETQKVVDVRTPTDYYTLANNTYTFDLGLGNYFSNITAKRLYNSSTGWTIVGTNTYSTNATNTSPLTYTLVSPGTTAEGDIAIVVVTTDSATNALPTVNLTASPGWTTNNSVAAIGSSVFYKTLGATPDTTIVLNYGATDYAAVSSIVIRSSDILPVYVIPIAIENYTSATSGRPTPPATTTTIANTLVVTAGALRNDIVNVATSTGPTGYSNFTLASSHNNVAGTAAAAMVATKFVATVSTETPTVYNLRFANSANVSDYQAAWTFRIAAYLDPTIILTNTSPDAAYPASTYVLHINSGVNTTTIWSGVTFKWQSNTAPTLSGSTGLTNNIVILETIDGSTFRGAALTSYAE